MISLRDYQSRLVSECLAILRESDRCVLQMPMGTGKTATALAIVDLLYPSGNQSVIWMVHQSELVKQAWTSAINNFDAKIDGDPMSLRPSVRTCAGNSIMFCTWSTLRDYIDTDVSTKALLICDEIHYGGTGEDDHLSYTKIFRALGYAKHLYVSATPWNLDPDLFGEVSSAQRVVYTWAEAMQDGYVHDIDFIRYFSGLELLLAPLSGTAPAKTLTADSPEELALAAEAEKVDVSDESVRVLNAHKAHGMIEQYLRREVHVEGKLAYSLDDFPPTIVFCRPDFKGGATDMLTVSALESTFQKIMRRLGIVVGGVHPVTAVCTASTQSKGFVDANDVVQQFRKGQPRVIFVCSMLNEGFDYPELECALDFNLNPANASRTFQKIGRLSRVKDGKRTSRYYYAETVRDYLQINGVHKRLTQGAMEIMVNQPMQVAEVRRKVEAAHGIEDRAEVVDAAIEILRDVLPEDDVEVIAALRDGPSEDAAQIIDALPEEPRKSLSQLLDLLSADREFTEIQTTAGESVLEAGILKRNTAEIPEDEIDLYPADVQVMHEDAREAVKALDYDTGAQAAREFTAQMVTQNKVIVSALIRTPMLIKAANVTAETARYSLSECVQTRDGAQDPSGKKAAILAFIREHGRRPSRFSKDPEEKRLGQALDNYVHPSKDTFDPAFKAEVDALCPSTVDPSGKKAAIIAFIHERGRRPSRHSKDPEEKRLGQALDRYVHPSSSTFDPAFKAEVDTLCPSIAPARDPSGKKAAILAFIRERGRRPSAYSKNPEEKRLGQALNRYVVPSSDTFDPAFKAKVDSLCPPSKGGRKKKARPS